MDYIEPNLKTIKAGLSQLKDDSKPQWGSMSSIRMVEHLTDTVTLSKGDHSFELTIPEDKVEKAQQFLDSKHPLPKNFEVPFAKKETPIRNNSINDAISEFENAWNSFDIQFTNSTGQTTLHPSFGILNYNQWLRLHSKHVSHHLEQFGIKW